MRKIGYIVAFWAVATTSLWAASQAETIGYQPIWLMDISPETFAVYGLVVLGLLGLSAIISGYEVAFFSLSPQTLEDLAENKQHFSDSIVLKLHKKPQRLLATILLSNNLVNVGLILLMAFLLGQLRTEAMEGWLWVFAEAAVITALLLLLGEITPKVYATHRQLLFLRLFSPVIQLLFYVFYPLSWVLARSSRFLYRKPEVAENQITYQELKHAIELTDISNSPPSEKQILKALVNLNNIPVKAIMRARVDIVALEVGATNAEVFDRVNATYYSRYPVYEQSIDEIRGVLHVKDLMPVLEDDSLNWQAYLRQPFFVPESKKIGYLLNEFREKRIHLAIVVDEFGGTAGMVTLQDVLDEIFGEIREETAKEAQLIQPISETEFLVMAKTPLLELCRTLGLEETMFEEVKGEHDTVGGLLLEMLGKFPKAGEEISFAHLRFMVLAVTARKILQVRLTVLPPKVDED